MESSQSSNPPVTGGDVADSPAGTRHRPGRIPRSVRRGIEAGKQKYSGSSADVLWRRLNSVDFLNQGMVFAGTLLLCAFPVLIVATALVGRSAATGLGRRLGLDPRAADDLGHLFTSSSATSQAVTGLAWVFLILSGYAVATSLQGLYLKIFGMQSKTTRDMPRALIWLILGAAWLYGVGLVGPGVRRAGPVVFAIVGLVAFTCFWWFTMWFLMAGRISWRSRRVLPGHGSGLRGHVLRHDHLERPKVRAGRDRVRPDVVFHRDRGGDHPGRGDRPRVARADHPQERAAHRSPSGKSGGPVTDVIGPEQDARREAGRRYRAAVRALPRVVGSTTGLVAIYYLLPLDHSPTWAAVIILTAGLVLLTGLIAWQVRLITAHQYPAVRAAEALAITIPLFLLLFASTYVFLGHVSAANFGERLTHTDALYFTVTVFSTVGFGDITAKTEAARLVVTGQMLTDLVVLGLGLKVIIGAVSRGQQQRQGDGGTPPAE
jgi:voltage-gated potassium channel